MEVTINWKRNTWGETGFNVYRDTAPMDAQNLGTQVGTAPARATSFVDATVVADTLYYYRVAAVYQGAEYISDNLAVNTSQSFNVPISGLTGYYQADTLTNGTLVDALGSLNGSVTAGAPTLVTGVFGSAVYVAPGDVITIPPGIVQSSDYFAIAIWKYGVQEVNSTFLNIEDGSGNRAINLHFPYGTDGGRIYFDCGNSGSTYDRIDKQVGTAHRGWHHWVFQKDRPAGRMEIYFDGSLWHSGTGKTRTIQGAGQPVTLGGSNHEGGFDELAFYSRVLTQSEITELASQTPPS